MKIYHKNSQFLHNLIVYSLTSLVCSLFFSYPHWFPSLWLSINHFLFTSLPNIWSFFFNPKCIFLVGNTIILFLIGEWKLLGSQSPAAEIYDEYAERSRASRRVLSALQEAKEMELEKNLVEEKRRGRRKDGDEDGEEDQPGLPAEELNKRVEEFIARINKQRWLEAKLLVHDDSSPEDMQF
ncbi:hypothetical protein AAG906_004012 [Vitis piasezkii]